MADVRDRIQEKKQFALRNQRHFEKEDRRWGVGGLVVTAFATFAGAVLAIFKADTFGFDWAWACGAVAFITFIGTVMNGVHKVKTPEAKIADARYWLNELEQLEDRLLNLTTVQASDSLGEISKRRPRTLTEG